LGIRSLSQPLQSPVRDAFGREETGGPPEPSRREGIREEYEKKNINV